MDLKQIALFAWMPFLAADFGCVFGGLVAMRLQKRSASASINARRCAFTLGAVLMLGVGFVGIRGKPVRGHRAAQPGGFAHQTLSVTVITMSSDLFRRNEVATAAGMAGTFGNAGLLIFSLLIGGLVATVGYTPFFICLGLLDLVGAACLVDTGPRTRDAATATRRSTRSNLNMPAEPCRIRNPILPGFNPDPSIVRVGDDYYIATSTFEWYPGRADPPLARPGPLASVHTAAAPRQPAQHARRSGFLRRLGAVPELRRRAFWLIYTDVKRYGRTTQAGAGGRVAARLRTTTW